MKPAKSWKLQSTTYSTPYGAQGWKVAMFHWKSNYHKGSKETAQSQLQSHRVAVKTPRSSFSEDSAPTALNTPLFMGHPRGEWRGIYEVSVHLRGEVEICYEDMLCIVSVTFRPRKSCLCSVEGMKRVQRDLSFVIKMSCLRKDDS